MKTRVLRWQISGDFITSQARDFFLEEGWDRSLSFLIESLGGMTADIAIDIVRGRQRLVGDVHGMDIADEPEEVREDFLLREVRRYAGIRREGGSWWQPYAVVVVWGPDDMRKSSVRMSPRYGWRAGDHQEGDERHVLERSGDLMIWTQDKTDFFEARSVAYMDDPRIDRAQWAVYRNMPADTGAAYKEDDERAVLMVPTEIPVAKLRGYDGERRDCILFRPVPAPPFWISGTAKTWQESVDRYVEHHELREVGAEPSGDSPEPSLSLLEQYRDNQIKGGALPPRQRLCPGLHHPEPSDDSDRILNLPFSQAEKWLDEAVAQENAGGPKAVSGSPESYANGGWVTRDGTFYGCGYHEHAELARLLLLKKGAKSFEKKPEVFGTASEAEEWAAIEEGWLQIRNNKITGQVEATANVSKRRPSSAQRKMFEEWCLWHHHEGAKIVETEDGDARAQS